MTNPSIPPADLPETADAAEALRAVFPPVKVQLAGRTWIEVPPALQTVEYDVAVMRLMRDSKLDSIDATGVDLANEDSTQGLLRSVLERVLMGGHFFSIVGTMLVEEGTVWTPEVASQNAKRFAAITDRGEKQTLYDLAARLVLGFSLAAIASIETSPSFSALAEVGEAVVAAPADESAPQ